MNVLHTLSTFFRPEYRRRSAGRTGFALCVCLLLLPWKAQGQFLPVIPDFLQDYGQPALQYGFDKIANTYHFNANGQGAVQIWGTGELHFNAGYRSRVISRTQSSVRDDAEGSLEYVVPLAERLSAVAGINGVFSDDSNISGLTKLLKSATPAGLRYRDAGGVAVELLSGPAYNEQQGVVDRGYTIQGRGLLRQFAVDEYVLDANAFTEIFELSNQRSNAHSGISLQFSRAVEEGGRLNIVAQYANLLRDFYSFSGADGTIETSVLEVRDEERWGMFGHLRFPLWEQAAVGLSATLENRHIDKFFSRAYGNQTPVERTLVNRSLDFLRLHIEARGDLYWHNARLSLGLKVESRDELNTVSARFNIAEVDLRTLQRTENERDFSDSRNTLWLEAALGLFTHDTLSFHFSGSLLRHDTPSDDNNSDRDELTFHAGARYRHRFSSILSAELRAELNLLHQVYLRAELSRDNSWNRIIRLEPAVEITTRRFSARPRFEVLANFTSYDFEEMLSTNESFSMRQISYRDSLRWQSGATHWFEMEVLLRYFERGRFRWSSFSEAPRNENFEQFCRLLLFTSAGEAITIGVGGRLYSLRRSMVRSFNELPDFQRTTLAPETVIRAAFGKGSSIALEGWYEFEFLDGNEARRFPNVFLQTNLVL